jgi:cation diffusion facilitator family transporter
VAGPEAGTKATVTALGANFCIAVAKFVAFGFTASASMLAEGIHSVADTGNQALLLVGMRRARRAATAEHPFGYGRERYFWSFIVALILFTVGGLASIYEGWTKLRDPHDVESLGWAFGVLTVAIVLEIFSLRVAVREINRVRTSGWWGFIRRSKNPELPVVLLEDLGALVGLVFALGGVGLAALTGNARFDAAGSLAIGILLCTIAIVLAIELKSLLLGESASPSDIDTITGAITADSSVRSLIHMRTQHIGPDELLVGAKVHLRDDLSLEQVAAAINRIESSVRERVPAAKMIYIEPDVTATAGTASS